MKLKGYVIPTVIITLLLLTQPIFGAGFTDEEKSSTVSIKELDSPPKPVKQVQPKIPASLKGKKASIQVGFIITKEGAVTAPRIVKSTDTDFNDIAKDCVTKWKFKPGEKGGASVPVRVIIPLRFK